MFVVARIQIPDKFADEFEQGLADSIDTTLVQYGFIPSDERKAEAFSDLVTIYQTKASSSYMETTLEIAEDAEGNRNLIEAAIDGLRADILAEGGIDFSV